MTREEEIVQAANENYPSLDSEKSYEGFKDGAKWADQHPKYTALESLLKFIDSLTEEPANKDLEEAAEAFYNNCNLAKSSWWDEGILHKMSESKETFIAGAEWQKENHNKQFGFLNLKDCKDAYNRWKSTQDNTSAALAWVRACEWQKQQMKEALQTEYEKGRFDMREEMMKALIGGEVVKDIHNQLSVKSEPLNDAFRDIKFGDKVKIIIVKTEQQ